MEKKIVGHPHEERKAKKLMSEIEKKKPQPKKPREEFSEAAARIVRETADNK